MTEPTLHAVVEINHGPTTWVATPPSPWPDFVRLFKETLPAHISLILNTLAFYNSLSSDVPVLLPDALAQEDSLALPGGLAATSGSRIIYPSCCSGLEEWRDWFKLLDGTGSPWLGHDPSPFVQSLAETFIVWPDGGLTEHLPSFPESISFTRSQLEAALKRVSVDLSDFVSVFQTWCNANGIPSSEAIVQNFSKSFLYNEHGA